MQYHEAARVTQFTLSLLPEDDIDSHSWTITVEYRGRDLWAVKRGPYTLSSDGAWEYELLPSSREDDYLARCRFLLEQALHLAEEALPKITVNGLTAPMMLEWRETGIDPRKKVQP